ncbi:BspA family leucine-rich repeat surface protein, partial [Hallella colorans]|uniref:BspA family leucine-rich repeat surface protein n=1 Tax=Hallella colorans TaxID=1703337 RepID=UPI0028893C58
MFGMFGGCSSLTSLDLTNFNTKKVTDMRSMFFGCRSLTSLNLTNFNTKKVTDMYGMFENCSSMTTIYCNDDWSVGSKLEYYYEIFSNCPNLKGEGAAYDYSKNGIEMANPTTGYFTAKTSGIDHVTAAGKVGNGKIYDLSGRQVSKNYRGVVITNGRKILQR